MRLGSRAEDRQFARGLRRIGQKSRGQRSYRAQLRQQKAGALRLGKTGIVEVRLHETEHFADRAPVRVGVLAQIECCEMKAESIDRASQILQAAFGQDPAAVGDKRAIEDRKIAQQFAAVAIERRVANGVLPGFEMIEHPRRRRQPRVDPGNCPPVWLVLSVG